MLRLLAAGVVALFALIGYCTSAEENPITGEEQRIREAIDRVEGR